MCLGDQGDFYLDENMMANVSQKKSYDDLAAVKLWDLRIDTGSNTQSIPMVAVTQDGKKSFYQISDNSKKQHHAWYKVYGEPQVVHYPGRDFQEKIGG